jgi:hypothetical protein
MEREKMHLQKNLQQFLKNQNNYYFFFQLIFFVNKQIEI